MNISYIDLESRSVSSIHYHIIIQTTSFYDISSNNLVLDDTQWPGANIVISRRLDMLHH
jgi:hypothetical protein